MVIFKIIHRWLTLPFTENHIVCRSLKRTFMPGIWPDAFIAVFKRKLQWEESGPFIWIPASLSCLASFVIGSMFQDHKKWEIQPLLEKFIWSFPFLSTCIFGDHYLSMCLSVVAFSKECAPCSYLFLLALCPRFLERGSLSQGCPRRLGAGINLGGLFC